MSVAVSVGKHWPGFSSLKHLVIFGASYCQVGYDSKKPHPSPDNPLGVKWPGITWTERDQPNWVGHLLREHTNNQPLLIYDYASGGDNVFDVQRQIETQFLPHVAKRPDWAPWAAEDTLFMTWVGINDVGGMSEQMRTKHPDKLPSHIRKLFELHGKLYEEGARNFLLFDLPPLQRAPGVPAHLKNSTNSPHAVWNNLLQVGAKTFADQHPDATVMVFSSWATFNRVLDNPTDFGFTTHDVEHEAGIWLDQVHPTSRMHHVIAQDLASFLQSVSKTNL